MSDVFWAAIISGATAIVVTLLTQWLSIRIASQQSAQTERIERLKWELSESSRQEAVLREQARQHEERQAKWLRECWEHVLASSERVKRLSRIYGSGREPSAQEEPSVYSAQACAVALLGLKTVYPLAKGFHDATVLLQINAREVGFPAVPLSLHAWGQSLEALEEEIARQTGVAPVPDGAVSDEVPMLARSGAQKH